MKSDLKGLAAREALIVNTESPTARARDLRVKKSPELLAEILQTIREGQPITRAARLCGVNPDSVHRWRAGGPRLQ
jgi:transposase-like protein